jgi:glycosyltransferase involved in cell wall biosynthesis
MLMVSLVISAKNEGNHVQNTILSAFQAKTNHPFEIIVVDDASEDECCDFITSQTCDDRVKLIQTTGIGLTRARNLGAEQSKGSFLIFCDAHLFFEDFWIDRLIEPIRTGLADAVNPTIADAAYPNNVGRGITWNDKLEFTWNVGGAEHCIQSPLLAGGCLAISREVFFNVGGFDRDFKVCGHDDEEFSLKLWLFGYTCGVQPDVKVRHVFRPQAAPYNFSYDDSNYNLMRLAYSHFNVQRIEKCKKLIKFSNSAKIESQVLQSNVLKQRRYYFVRRKYDDEWFMNKFRIPF